MTTTTTQPYAFTQEYSLPTDLDSQACLSSLPPSSESFAASVPQISPQSPSDGDNTVSHLSPSHSQNAPSSFEPFSPSAQNSVHLNDQYVSAIPVPTELAELPANNLSIFPGADTDTSLSPSIACSHRIPPINNHPTLTRGKIGHSKPKALIAHSKPNSVNKYKPG
ncbi:unnamed protein product [Vicia faba]|uniref:Uncharacterized protein n=1 Tax=Vicia faba TaxID=3906 RepID=A0AAV0ZHZ1_VICFA|nr:unnamed protein product [Vicia faba]